jgi:DNA-binding NarL/FixJ family response regulator
MDIAMPLLNGLQATRQIMDTFPSIRVLILSANSESEYFIQAVTSGASGYLIKQSSTQFLPQAIREVLKGNTYFSASIAKALREQCQKIFDKTELVKKKSAPLTLQTAA